MGLPGYDRENVGEFRPGLPGMHVGGDDGDGRGGVYGVQGGRLLLVGLILDFGVDEEGECGVEGVGEDVGEMGGRDEVGGLVEESAEGRIWLEKSVCGRGGVDVVGEYSGAAEDSLFFVGGREEVGEP